MPTLMLPNQLHRAADGAMAKAVGHAGDDEAALIALDLRVFADERLDAIRVADVDEMAAEDRYIPATGLSPVRCAPCPAHKQAGHIH